MSEQLVEFLGSCESLLHPVGHLFELFLAVGNMGKKSAPEFIKLSIHGISNPAEK
jgi:hypothetical protein